MFSYFTLIQPEETVGKEKKNAQQTKTALVSSYQNSYVYPDSIIQ